MSDQPAVLACAFCDAPLDAQPERRGWYLAVCGCGVRNYWMLTMPAQPAQAALEFDAAPSPMSDQG
jgi:hypothetical protein